MKARSVLLLLLVVIVALGLSSLSYFGVGEKQLFGVKNISQGLDLKGGVSIEYQADKENPTKDEMNSALSLIRARLDRKNYTEAEVAIQNANRLRVDIPAVDDAEQAVSDIGKTAQLTFVNVDGEVLLTGSQIKNAYKSVDNSQTGNGAVVVALEFDSEGAKAFEKATGDNVGKILYIMLDDEILSAPTVNTAISGGNAIIQGNFTPTSAEELAALIRSGSLPFKLSVVSLSNVGAKLGADSLSTSIMAGVVGFTLVMVFMLIFYKVPGIAADLALIIYLTIILIIFSIFRFTLTLPGIAGIVLSVGMAVDANVIIFERIKEELNSGRTIKSSLDAGFSRAFPAILDGNVTTLIAALVLFWLGTGPIKGFAQTLSIGIMISMFTAIVITRLILKLLVGAGANNPKMYGAK